MQAALPISTSLFTGPLLAQSISSLSLDDAARTRLTHLIAPVDDAGTRGSYAGWIARSALREAAGNAPVLDGLARFFQRGGSLKELESLAAPLLSRLGPPLLTRARPLTDWRLRRLGAVLDARNVPASASKVAELEDRDFRIGGEEAFSSGQRTAYLEDEGSRKIAETIEREATELLPESVSRDSYLDSVGKIKESMGEGAETSRVTSAQIAGALLALNDADSAAVAGRIEKSYKVIPSLPGEFESRVKERYRKENRLPPDLSSQSALYFPVHPVGGPAAIYLRSHPENLPWSVEPADRLFEMAANVVHEDRHHRDLTNPWLLGGERDHFPLEFRGNGDEIIWRSRHGDVRDLRRLTRDSFLGYAMAFRDRYEAWYWPKSASPINAPRPLAP